MAPYFLEEVRKELEGRFGAKQLYENGLAVQTALDVSLQEAANRALNDGLRRIDKRHGFRAPRRNVIADGQTIDGVQAAPLGPADARWRHRAGGGPQRGGRRDRRPRGGAAGHDRQERVRLDLEGRATSW